MSPENNNIEQQRRLLQSLGFGFLEETLAIEEARAEPAPRSPAMRPAPAREQPKQEALKGPALPVDERRAALASLRERVLGCASCGRHLSRANPLAGSGSAEPPIVFIVESPNPHEDRDGIICAGETGELLAGIVKAMKFAQEDVFITFATKCFAKRSASSEEVAACAPHLSTLLEVVRPEVIVAMGAASMESLFGQPGRREFQRQRGQWTAWRGIRVMPTYDPSYIVRNRDRKKAVWLDMQLVMAHFGKKP